MELGMIGLGGMENNIFRRAGHQRAVYDIPLEPMDVLVNEGTVARMSRINTSGLTA